MSENKNARAGGKAQDMAGLIESWLGNPIARRALGFFTKRDENSRRIEKVLKRVAGENVDFNWGDKISYLIVDRILEGISNKIDFEKEDLKRNLQEGYWRKGLGSVLEGIAWRGPEKPFTAYAPFLVVWNITKDCNLNCKHCYQDAGEPASDELTTEEALEAVDEMTRAGVAYIAIAGGEPLMRGDLFEVAERIKEQEMGFAIATNGTLLTEKNVKRLEELNCQYIEVSLDGEKETHNEMRGAGVYEKTLEGIKNAVNSDITVGVAMTVTKENYDEVDSVIDTTEEIGADIFMHFNFVPVGRAKEMIELDISPEEREQLLRKLADEMDKRDINLLSTAPQFGRVTAVGSEGTRSLTHFDAYSQQKGMGEETEFLAEFVGGCGIGRLYCGLQQNGDVIPCVFLPKVLGNIKEDDFEELWKNNEFLEKTRNRDKLEGVCGNCDYRDICGGCRARAYGYFDDSMESDPGCVIDKHGWKRVKEKYKK